MAHVHETWDRPAIDILIDLIYHTNRCRPPILHTTFGQPQYCDQRPDLADDFNTFIPAKVPDWFDYRFSGPGQEGFLYNRIDISTLAITNGFVIAAPTAPYRIFDILDQLNAAYEVQFTEVDLVNTLIDSDTQEITLQAAASSLIWTGTKQVTVTSESVMFTSHPYLNGFVDYWATT